MSRTKYGNNWYKPSFFKLRVTSLVPINAKGYQFDFNLSSIMVSLMKLMIFIYAKALIMSIFFLEQARGHHVGDPWHHVGAPWRK